MNRLLLAATAATVAALTLSACGTTEPAADDQAKPASKKISLTDASGKKVTLDGPAKKVVGTEWNAVEHLVSLGVDPVGVADVKGYNTWDKSAPLTNDPKDIGTRGEPSVESVAALSPDLVVATTDLPASALKQLREVSPVLVIKSADAADPIGQMNKNLDLIAEATGTTDEGDKLQKDFEAKLAEGKKAVADAGLDGAPFAFADGYDSSNQVSVRPFTKGSLIGAVSEELGLKTAWKEKGDEAYGLGSTDVEGLTKLDKETHFAYIGNDKDKAATPFTGALADNKVWKSLPFVKEDRVHRLDDGIWMFGGTASMEAYVDSLVAELTK